MPRFVMELCMIAQCCGVGILRMVADDIINILFGNVVQDETRTKHVLIPTALIIDLYPISFGD
jgi:hypothetical protein